MATRYTKPVTTPYVNTYAPMDMNQMGQLMRSAAGFQAEIADADARSEALMTSVSPQNPEGQKFIKGLTERQKENIASREGESLAQRAIRAKTAGIRTAGAINSLKQTNQNIRDWEDKVREINKDISDQEELNFRIANNRPTPNYDYENFAVSADIPNTFKLSPDVNYAEKVDDFMSGTEARNLGITKRINPRTGEEEITTTEGVSLGRAKNILDLAFASDPDIQQYKKRRSDYYGDLIELQGAEETLESMIENAPNSEAKEEIIKQINKNKNQPLAQTLGSMMATNEIRNAQGFGTSKYAYTELDTKYRSPMKGSAMDRLNKYGYGLTEFMNNPQIADVKRELTLQSVRDEDKDEYTGGALDSGTKAVDAVADWWNREDIMNKKDIDEIVSSDYMKKSYGDAVKTVHENIGGKPDGMSNSEYIETILKPAYDKKIKGLSRLQRGYKTIDDPDTMKDLHNIVIGDNSASGFLGLINKAKIKNATPGMETGPLALSDIADDYGIDLTTSDGRRELQGKFSMIGTSADNSSYFVRAYKDDGVLGTDNTELILEVNNPNIAEKSIMSNRFFNLQSSPKKTKETFEIPLNGDKVEFEAIAKDTYIDPETKQELSPSDPRSVYQKRIIFKGDNSVYTPEDEGYGAILKHIQNN